MSAASPAPTPPAIEMRDVVAGYYQHDLVLDRVSLAAHPGRVTAVLGPNGSGKSTSLRVLYGFLRPRSGTVRLGGRDVTALPVQDRLELGIALLPQGRTTFPQLTVEENLELGAWLKRRDRAGMRRAVAAMYERYPVLAGLRRRPAGSLSGGQQRLLEIARMLVLDPQVILVDEPSVGLAPILVEQVYEELRRLKEEGRTILLVDQNVEAAVALADYVYVLAYGRNHLEGAREDFEHKLGEVIRGWLRLRSG